MGNHINVREKVVEYFSAIQVEDAVIEVEGRQYVSLEVVVLFVGLCAEASHAQRTVAAAWHDSWAVQDRYKLRTLQDFVTDVRQLSKPDNAYTKAFYEECRQELLRRNEIKVRVWCQGWTCLKAQLFTRTVPTASVPTPEEAEEGGRT
ncbi:MAG: hypothetical protein EOO40_04735 [Deltaproteobacteria bacterium]|nr:MAG: hypothetical protein EOO40_04735 [Deltaproteobacteria bacterium]